MLLTLPGCAASGAGGRVELPSMPSRLQQACPVPPVAVGMGAKKAALAMSAALAVCERRRADAVGFYEDARRRLGRASD